MSHRETIAAFLHAIQAREDATRFYCADVIQREFPNLLVKQGATRDLAALRASAERGKQAVLSEQYEILNVIEQGDSLALEAVWTAQLAVPFGTIPAGGTMRARLGMFFTFRDGRIATQHNYDCFEPF